MPSIYFGCQIDDEISDALRVYRGTLEEIRQRTKDDVAAMKAAVTRLSANKAKAKATIGVGANDQVLWQAVEGGPEGNQISIIYIYLGPDSSSGTVQSRSPSAFVIGTAIYCVLPVVLDGSIYGTMAFALAVWTADPELSALVTGTLVGAGTDPPTIQSQTFLTDGVGTPLTDAEDAANDIARPFGHQTYQELLTAVDIPVVESAADAAKFLRDQNDDFVIINGKLLIVDGTNLVGINALYDVAGQDVEGMKNLLETIDGNETSPTYVTTQNVETTTVQLVCGKPQEFTVVTETLRDTDVALQIVAARWSSGDLSAFNNYFFWNEQTTASRHTRTRIVSFGMPEEYVSDIVTGESPEQLDDSQVQAPGVFVVEDPELFSRLGFTDAEIALLMAENVDGVRIPGDVPFEDRARAIGDITDNDHAILDNGLRSSVRKSIAAAQSLDLEKTLAEPDLSQELATRGKACARQEKHFDESTAAFPNLDLPNLPTPDLPISAGQVASVSAAQVESAFGALSSVLQAANAIFGFQMKAVMGAVDGLLNALTNMSSLADNLLKNDLLQCLLGTDGAGTGLPDIPGVGSGAPGGLAPGGSEGIGAPTVGGIPLPVSFFVDALKSLSTELDETITDAFESLMNLIRQPLCQIQNLISSILGFDLEGELNPCKKEKELDESCPPEETQEIINASGEMTSALDGMAHLAKEATEKVTKTVEESVEQFTGEVRKTVTETTNTIDRGVKKILEDVQKSLDSKVDFLDKIDAAVRSLMGEVRETKISADEDEESTLQCSPPSLGMFTDAISNFL